MDTTRLPQGIWIEGSLLTARPVGALIRDDLTGSLYASTNATVATYTQISSGMAPGALIGSITFVEDPVDLPAAVVGVRTLLDGVGYVLLDNIDIGTDVLTCGGDTTIVGYAESVSGITTSSASPLLSCSGSVTIHDCSLTNTGAGKVFELTPASGKGVHFDSVDVINGAADTIAGAAGAKELGIHGCHWEGADGLIISGAWEDLDITTTAWRDLDSTAVMLTLAAASTYGIAILDDLFFITNHANQTGLDIDSGIVPTAEGEVRGCAFTGAGTFLDAGGVNQETIGWWFSNNPGVEDSAAIGEMDYDGNTTPTVITDGTSWHVITGTTFTMSPLSERFDEPAEGQLRYLGKDPKRMVLILEMTAETAANNKTLNVRVRQYDASATTTSTVRSFNVDIRSTAQPQAAVKSTVVDLHQNDYLFLEIGSNDGTNMTIIEAGLLAHTG